MWPFSKKSDSDAELPQFDSEDHHWSVMEAEYDGGPLIIRLNETAAEWNRDRRMSLRIGFAVPLLNPVPGGLPDPEENEQLSAVEDLIVQALESSANGLLVLAMTTGEMKELVFYAPRKTDVESLHQVIQQQVASHEVQCYAEEDPAWETYNDMAAG